MVLTLVLSIACAGTPPAPPPPSSPTALAPCPSTPNCVTSEADPADAEHWMAALPLRTPPAEARARLVAIVAAMPRTALVEERDDYLRFTFTSRTWRFVDDVEFVLDPAAGIVRFRSASRVGRGDMGVNRARMEAIAAQWGG